MIKVSSINMKNREYIQFLNIEVTLAILFHTLGDSWFERIVLSSS